MPRADELYVISKDMSVRTLKDAVRPFKVLPFPLPHVEETQDDALALSPSGTLEAGVAYSASDGSARSFALPTYTLQETAGRYATSLKWLETTQPGGAIARLTIGLSRTLPVAPAGGSIEEIAHEISARLVYAVPVESAAGDASESWLSIPLGAVNRVDEQASQLVLDVNTKAEFDRLWSAMTNPAAKGRLELRCFATIGRRTWRQVIPDRVGLLDQMSLLNDRGVLLTHIVKPPPLIQVEPQRPPWRRPPVRELRPDFRRSVLTEPASPLVINAAPMRMRAVRTLDTAMMMRDVATPLSVLADSPAVELTPVASRRALHDVFRPEMAEAVQVSDLLVDRKRVLPIRAIIDKRGRPALIRINAEAVQSVPFGFDVGLNAYMFDVPGDLRPVMTHVLLRAEFDAGEGRPPVVYYQDSAFPNHYYYEPQEFRIPRRDEAPYLPALNIAFFDVVQAPDAGDGAILYRAHLAYRAVPYLDGIVLARLRQSLEAGGGNAVLSALVPEQATLRLRLPDEAGSALVDVERPEATINLDDGIVDEVQLTPEALAAVITALQTGGLTGQVEASLPGQAETSIPIRLSLHDANGTILDRSYRGPVGDGRVRITLRNRIESPLRIGELLATPAGTGFAFPETAPGLQIASGALADIDYRLDPPGLVVTDIDPVLRMTIDPDLPALLPKIMVNKGYASKTFRISLSVDPIYFGQTMPGDAQALAAVLVEFTDDATVVLDAAGSTDEIDLRLPILGWLLKQPESERYSYRVTNLLGAGADVTGTVGAWIEGSGAGALAIVPAGA